MADISKPLSTTPSRPSLSADGTPGSAPAAEKPFGTLEVFSIAAGAMISSGLFVLPGPAYEIAGPSIILAYLLAAILYLPALFAQAELATAMP